MEKKVAPSGQGPGTYKNLTQSQADEDAFNYVQHRTEAKKTSLIGAVAHMVKGALGAGVLSGHVAFMKAGVAAAIPLCLLCGLYMYYCLYILVKSSTTMCKRTRVPFLTYSDTGEAALACCPSPKLAKWSRCFRLVAYDRNANFGLDDEDEDEVYAVPATEYFRDINTSSSLPPLSNQHIQSFAERVTIDAVIGFDLFGSCACYHIIIARTLKQLVENQEKITDDASGNSPSIRVYMALLILPVVAICLIRHLKWLAPFSLGANFVVALAIFVAIYYAFVRNPTFSDLVPFRDFTAVFEFIGMSVFSMSCAGVVIPIENNMSEPRKFPRALAMGMFLIVLCVFSCSFFGYVAFRENSKTPITLNFPMTIFCLILKGLIAFMITVTFALNFWVPFNITFYYIKPKLNPNKLVAWEYFFRVLFVILICCVAIAFPAIDNLIGFIGSICLSNMAFIWPNVIALLVIWTRPGFGPGKVHLWKHLFLIIIGLFLLIAGTYVNGTSLIKSLF